MTEYHQFEYSGEDDGFCKCGRLSRHPIHTPEPSAAPEERLFANTQPPPKDKETTRFPAVEPSVEQRAKELADLYPYAGYSAVLDLAKRAILAEDALKTSAQEIERLKSYIKTLEDLNTKLGEQQCQTK